MSEKPKAEVLSRRQMLGFGGVAVVSGYVGVGRKSATHKRPAWRDVRLYQGPMRLPNRVLDIAATGRLCRTRDRHNVIRISDGGVVYLLRCFGRSEYLGEIVRAERGGGIRVHVWVLIDCPDAWSTQDLIAYHAYGVDVEGENEAESERLDVEQEKFA